LALTLLFGSCKEEPSFKEQLVGNWVSTEVLSGNTNLSGSNTFTLNLQATDEFDLDIVSVVPISGEIRQSFLGDWQTDDKKQDLILKYEGYEESKTWEIIAISNTSLKASMIENNVRYQLTFKRQ
jgi:hypothetical protein